MLPASALDPDFEQERIALAVENALADFRRMRKKLDGDINKEALAIFDLFTHLLNDPMLRKDLKAQIQKGIVPIGRCAKWSKVIRTVLRACRMFICESERKTFVS